MTDGSKLNDLRHIEYNNDDKYKVYVPMGVQQDNWGQDDFLVFLLWQRCYVSWYNHKSYIRLMDMEIELGDITEVINSAAWYIDNLRVHGKLLFEYDPYCPELVIKHFVNNKMGPMAVIPKTSIEPMLSCMGGAAVRAYFYFRSVYDRKQFRHVKNNYVRIHRVYLINLWDMFGNYDFTLPQWKIYHLLVF